MGKFNEYSQKATPADNDTLMIYDATSKANKLSPFSGIWNWIVGKLTNAVISNLRTNNQTMIGAINELKSNTHLGTLNDNIAEYLSKTNGAATTYFVWGNIGGLYPSWAWGTLLCSNDNTANFIGIANSNKVAAFAHYENGAWEKVPVESLSNLTTTNKNSLVDAINELNSKAVSTYDMGNYYNDYTFAKFLQEKQGTGITILSGYTGYLFSDLPTDLSDAVNVITYKGNNQKSGIYSQGFISDSLGHRYTFVADASFSNVTFNKF